MLLFGHLACKNITQATTKDLMSNLEDHWLNQMNLEMAVDTVVCVLVNK